MNSITKIFISIFTVYLGCASIVNATTVSTDWWSNKTSELNIMHSLGSNHERIRLYNFTDGFVEGTVTLPFASNWNLEFTARSDESSSRDPNDSINIYIDGSLIEIVLNNPARTIFDIQHLVNGSSFDYRFEFVSSNSIYHLHPAVFEGSITSAVPIPAAVWLFGSGLIGFIGMKNKSSKISA